MYACRIDRGALYNEMRNITRCLGSIVPQKLHGYELAEVIVVSSGGTDGTDAVVRDYAERAPCPPGPAAQARGQELRSEPLHAMQAVGDILVLVNADNVLAEGALQKLLEPFNDPQVGIVGGPCAGEPRDTVGFAVNMLWDMHHRLSLLHPK